jgi:hypothetical protein
MKTSSSDIHSISDPFVDNNLLTEDVPKQSIRRSNSTPTMMDWCYITTSLTHKQQPIQKMPPTPSSTSTSMTEPESPFFGGLSPNTPRASHTQDDDDDRGSDRGDVVRSSISDSPTATATVASQTAYVASTLVGSPSITSVSSSTSTSIRTGLLSDLQQAVSSSSQTTVTTFSSMGTRTGLLYDLQQLGPSQPTPTTSSSMYTGRGLLSDLQQQVGPLPTTMPLLTAPRRPTSSSTSVIRGLLSDLQQAGTSLPTATIRRSQSTTTTTTTTTSSMRADPGKHLRGLLSDLQQAGPSPVPPILPPPSGNTDPAYHEHMRNMSRISALSRGGSLSSSSSSLRQSPFDIRSSGSPGGESNSNNPNLPLSSSLLSHYDSNTTASEGASTTMITSSMMAPPLPSPSNNSRNEMTNSSSMIGNMGRSLEPPSPPNDGADTATSHDTATSDSTTSTTGSAMTTSSSIITRRTLPPPLLPPVVQPSAPYSPNISNTDPTRNIVRLVSDRDILYPTSATLSRSMNEITSINRTGRSYSKVGVAVGEKREDGLQQPLLTTMDDSTLIFLRRNKIRNRNMILNNNGLPNQMIKTISASASSISPQEIEKQHGGDRSHPNWIAATATKTETRSSRLFFPSPPKRTNSSRSDKAISHVYGLTATSSLQSFSSFPSSSLEEEDNSTITGREGGPASVPSTSESFPSTAAETYSVGSDPDLVFTAVSKDDDNDDDDEDYSSRKNKKGKS